MAVLNKEDFLKAVKARIGEDVSDDALAFVENMTDTFDSLSNSGGEDWKKKYEDNDKMWREKYRSRFFDSSTDDDNDGDSNDNDDAPEENKTPETFEQLFSESEG